MIDIQIVQALGPFWQNYTQTNHSELILFTIETGVRLHILHSIHLMVIKIVGIVL